MVTQRLRFTPVYLTVLFTLNLINNIRIVAVAVTVIVRVFSSYVFICSALHLK